jgi:hypothetical protein
MHNQTNQEKEKTQINKIRGKIKYVSMKFQGNFLRKYFEYLYSNNI